ncbi:GNAT family N-acetyltransferase [Phycicoccus sp. CSK15P-2]|uniref:GNAT family N-acetyltransferase n=1 Tax=Phycicoccus sp. CSK15P-2 TaxID=2807627 RepID=UPI001950C3EC|nr:GNAT family N-acetyltransferase [Phycicoccus sp. CSK15P-2]MBM6404333.1 GNAT family N-acetyltransferase [Phycicoccus sp. CSK15P-2]
MSRFTRELPSSEGTYRSGRLERALDASLPETRAWLVLTGPHPVGLAVTRDLDRPVRVLSALFLVAPVRGRDLGHDVARTVLESAPGWWAVAYQQENRAAAAFWPSVAATFDAGWRRELRSSPSRPDLPPDTWVTFGVGAGSHGPNDR